MPSEKLQIFLNWGVNIKYVISQCFLNLATLRCLDFNIQLSGWGILKVAKFEKYCLGYTVLDFFVFFCVLPS